MHVGWRWVHAHMQWVGNPKAEKPSSAPKLPLASSWRVPHAARPAGRRKKPEQREMSEPLHNSGLIGDLMPFDPFDPFSRRDGRT